MRKKITKLICFHHHRKKREEKDFFWLQKLGYDKSKVQCPHSGRISFTILHFCVKIIVSATVLTDRKTANIKTPSSSIEHMLIFMLSCFLFPIHFLTTTEVAAREIGVKKIYRMFLWYVGSLFYNFIISLFLLLPNASWHELHTHYDLFIFPNIFLLSILFHGTLLEILKKVWNLKGNFL